jgi:hypothetical protein
VTRRGIRESILELARLAASAGDPAVIAEAIRRAYALGTAEGAGDSPGRVDLASAAAAYTVGSLVEVATEAPMHRAVIVEAIRRAYGLGALEGAAAVGAFADPAKCRALLELAGERVQ